MADYSQSKIGPNQFPQNAIAVEHEHLEPILNPSQIRTRHLFGIPLYSQIQDPLTGKAAVMADPMIQDIIEGSVNQAEEELHIDIWPVKRAEKHPFDKPSYDQYGYLQLHHQPASSIDKIAITPANGLDIFLVPLEWVEVNYMLKGQINIVPTVGTFVQAGIAQSNNLVGGAYFLAMMAGRPWLPAYWQVDYTSGFIDSMVPRVINELIGTITSIEILSQLAATNARSQGHSLTLDGYGQSVTSPGNRIFEIRIKELEEKSIRITRKIKAKYGKTMFSGWV